MKAVFSLLIGISLVIGVWLQPGQAQKKQRVLSEGLRLHAGFPSRFLAQPRNVLVWVPPGYQTDRSRRYLVLYMHDGPNVFVTCYIDETARKLIAAKAIEPLIIVGVHNGGTFESGYADYTPTPMAPYKGRRIVLLTPFAAGNHLLAAHLRHLRGHGFSGQLLVSHRGIVDKACHDDRRLLHVVGLDSVIHIHI